MLPRVRRFAAHPFGGAAIHWIAASFRLTPAPRGSGWSLSVLWFLLRIKHVVSAFGGRLVGY